MPVDPLLEQMLHGFVEESQEICERVTRDLLELEKGARSASADGTFDDLASGLHTLKGSASTLGLDELAEVAHRMEDLVAPLRARLSLPLEVAAAPGSDSDITFTEAGDATWRVSTRQVSALLHAVERLREVRLRLEERQRELERGLLELARLRQQLRATGTSAAPPRPASTSRE